MQITNPNLGPLTTAYSQSGTDCHSIYVTNDGALVMGPNLSNIASCQPSGFIPYDGYYFSPGICPSDQTYACFALLGDESTAATCCPTGYECRLGRPATEPAACQSKLLSDRAFSVSEYVSTNGSTRSRFTTVFYDAGNWVFARGAVLWRANTDPLWATNTDSTMLSTSTQNNNSPTSVGSGTSRTDSDPATDPRSTDNYTGITTEARVAIGVGISFGVLLIAGAIITAFCIGKRKRRSMHEPTNQNYSHDKRERGAQSSWWKMVRYKGVVRAELEEQRRHMELYERRSPVEIMTQ
ncbi:hypothetical protein GGR51DRAFT_576178 [Nemania sp. FL0031]|nr:hypothetical protein GGR51DRAFT_576178 [Nemania sp. FL0031]